MLKATGGVSQQCLYGWDTCTNLSQGAGVNHLFIYFKNAFHRPHLFACNLGDGLQRVYVMAAGICHFSRELRHTLEGQPRHERTGDMLSPLSTIKGAVMNKRCRSLILSLLQT